MPPIPMLNEAIINPSLEEIGLLPLLMRLLFAVFFGGAIAWVYSIGHGADKGASRWTMMSTLVLLCILIAMVSLVIGNSVAKAFSLVGALSIVRFRTVVDDTRDTAFVIFAVIVGMAVGSGFFLVPAVGVPVVSIVAIAIHHLGGVALLSGSRAVSQTEATLKPVHYELTVRMGIGHDLSEVLKRAIGSFTSSYTIESVSTAKQGTSLEIVYRIEALNSVDPIASVASLNRIEGVQGVELKSFPA